VLKCAGCRGGGWIAGPGRSLRCSSGRGATPSSARRLKVVQYIRRRAYKRAGLPRPARSALGTAIVFARALPPSLVLDCRDQSWRALAFSAGGDGGRKAPELFGDSCLALVTPPAGARHRTTRPRGKASRPERDPLSFAPPCQRG